MRTTSKFAVLTAAALDAAAQLRPGDPVRLAPLRR